MPSLSRYGYARAFMLLISPTRINPIAIDILTGNAGATTVLVKPEEVPS